jgi:hypothetical protein
VDFLELAYYISPDGIEYPVFGGGRAAISVRGIGPSELTWITDKGPFQHGETVRDYRYQAQVVTLDIYERGACRQDWYCAEGELIDITRPNRGGDASDSGRLLIMRQDWQEFEIPARLLRGPLGDWDGQGRTRQSDLRERVQFFCADPFWHNPAPTTQAVELEPADSCLPLCLPLCLGSGNINEDVTILYGGTWFGDTMTLQFIGPWTGPAIRNETAGKEIRLNYGVAAGEVVTVTITPNVVTAVNNFGQKLKGVVNNLSDLMTFRLIPRGALTADGTNVINVSGAGGEAGGSGFSISYLTRYIGIFPPCT